MEECSEIGVVQKLNSWCF